MNPIRILAPAKVNLGLAILGKRPDGYHEIDTIMAMFDLYDEILISPSTNPGISISGMGNVPVESNLMTRAARLWSESTGIDAAWNIEITKRIPSPAGIGGGSSDATAVLKALNVLYGQPLSKNHLHEIAATLGADCPFFLNGPVARASGIGTTLRHIAPITGWLTLAIPKVMTSAKTARLYGSLTTHDYGDSSWINLVELDGTQSDAFPNSFLRPALEEFETLKHLQHALLEVTGHAILSGAGPGMFAISKSEQEAVGRSNNLREHAHPDVDIFTASFLQSSPEPELLP